MGLVLHNKLVWTIYCNTPHNYSWPYTIVYLMSFQLIGVIDLGHYFLSPYLCDPNALPKPMMAISSAWIQALYSNRAPLFISCEWCKVFSFVLLWWKHPTNLMLKCLVWVFYIIQIDYLSHSYSELDKSTARRRLKSPQSLYGTSTHPTIVTHRSQSWSWMINSQPFLSMSVRASTPIPQIRLFQTLTFKLQGQGHGCGQMARPCSHPSI